MIIFSYGNNKYILRRIDSMTNQTSYEQLPLMLNANQLAGVLGISRAGAYELMHSKGFPTLRIGKRMMVNKDHLARWIDRQSGGGT